MNEENRGEWLRSLTAHPAEEIKRLADTLSRQWRVRHKALPQNGLGMLTLSDGAFQEPFYLGEFPLAVAWVEIVMPDGGRPVEGAAQILSDDEDMALALALCDAILANRLSGWQEVAAMVRQGREKRREQDRVRRAMLAATRVDFSLLEAAEEEHGA